MRAGRLGTPAHAISSAATMVGGPGIPEMPHARGPCWQGQFTLRQAGNYVTGADAGKGSLASRLQGVQQGPHVSTKGL